MRSKLIMTTVVALAFAAATMSSAASAAPASPGACNMFRLSATGMDGMGQASDQGLGNMMALVSASIGAGCTF
jgi:Spy/CpxP family protein refolding chaperone